jgi:hypothetical protein
MPKPRPANDRAFAIAPAPRIAASGLYCIGHNEDFRDLSSRHSPKNGTHGLVRRLVDRGLRGLAELSHIAGALAWRDLADLRDELAIEREFQDRVVIVGIAADPDKAALVNLDAVLAPHPFVALARAAPGAQQIAVDIKLQHRRRRHTAFERGGLSVAPFSSLVSERGRWITQICPCQSTVMPPIWPMIQLLGRGFGQEASTVKVGISPAEAERGTPEVPMASAAVMQSEIVVVKRAMARAEYPRTCALDMASLPSFSCC